jgi:hypothetical protein
MQANSNKKEDLGEPDTHSKKESLPETAQEGKAEEEDGQHINMADLEVLTLEPRSVEPTRRDSSLVPSLWKANCYDLRGYRSINGGNDLIHTNHWSFFWFKSVSELSSLHTLVRT